MFMGLQHYKLACTLANWQNKSMVSREIDIANRFEEQALINNAG
jgi:hypothetical protein